MAEDHRQKVLVLGGGFGGIKAALELADNPAYSVSLLSDQTNFRYYPTLYRAATGGRLAASSIALTEIFDNKDVKIIKGTATKINRDSKNIETTGGKKYSYDILIIALGVVTNFFGIKGLPEYAYGIKSVEEAHRLRDHLHQLLEDEHKPDLNYVVIGGGPTGVELAGALAPYLKHIMKSHGITHKAIHIDLVEAANRLMPRMPKAYSYAIKKRLRKLGVKLYLSQTVEAETADALEVSGHSIQSHTVVWTAGVTNHPFFKDNDFSVNDRGKVMVDDFLQAETNVYVIGDNADTPYSGMAQTALYDAQFVAKNLGRHANGKPMKSYKPKIPVYVTPVGPRWAAVQWGQLHIYGWLGWMLRSAADLVGYHDYEPWWKASQHWVAEEMDEEECPVCLNAK